MAYTIDPEPVEVLETQVELNLSSKAQPFHFAVSNRALYNPRIKLIAKTDPYYFQRVPLSQVQLVTVKRIRPWALWVLSAVMIPVGLWTTIVMMEPILRKVPGKHEVSGWPISVFVCGFLVPLVARRRFALEILLLSLAATRSSLRL
jgi:hypothetical protein